MNTARQDSEATRVIEESVRAYYDSHGWELDGVYTRDASRWEDTRKCARSYVAACRLRICRYLPRSGARLLDAASGPVQYPEYRAYSEAFSKRICVDLSAKALKEAEARLGPKGEYIRCSILDLSQYLPENYADASISLHTIYHIEASAQETAVRQLLRVTKRGAPLLVVYANPDRLSSRAARFARKLKRSATAEREAYVRDEIYYHAHPLSWWSRFSDEADMDVVTWRTLTARVSRLAVPDNALGAILLRAVFWLEETFPRAMLPLAAYPLIILRKK